jgi:hypothetical protein
MSGMRTWRSGSLDRRRSEPPMRRSVSTCSGAGQEPFSTSWRTSGTRHARRWPFGCVPRYPA